ncbi:MAG: zf-HC2 domain-containing protein [candidate division Zixibacteria bacterium]|nr:zf-HC2 domain-containing protein [candidate division Zixibacteria bacterium]
MAKKCQDYISDLNSYLDGELSAELCEQIEKHLGQCRNCRIVVDTMKQTVSLCRDGKAEALPAALEDKLNRVLKARWEKKFGK